MRLEANGARQVRLENRHLVTARPRLRAPASAIPGLGDVVVIEMTPHDLRGWRFVRRP